MFASSAASHVSHPEASNSSLSLLVDAVRYASSSRLMESLLHDVRNPLNALAINAEVLMEKLKDDSGAIPPSQEKNLRAIREQVQRVDGVLRQFAQFLAPTRAPAGGDCALSELLQRALDVVGHESRRGRVKLKVQLEADVRIRIPDLDAITFLVFRSLLRAIERSTPGSEVTVALGEQEGTAVLTVRDAGASVQGHAELELALEELARRAGGKLRLRESELSVSLPLS